MKQISKNEIYQLIGKLIVGGYRLTSGIGKEQINDDDKFLHFNSDLSQLTLCKRFACSVGNSNKLIGFDEYISFNVETGDYEIIQKEIK